MAGAVPAEHGVALVVTTSGPPVRGGLPMSWRTADAIKSLGLEVPRHRSRQATDAEMETADLAIAAARENVRWMRGGRPHAPARTGTLKRLARDLAPADGTPFKARLA